MSTHRKVLSYWTEVKRIVDGEVKVTCCCCGEPGRRNGETMAQAGWRCRYRDRIKRGHHYSYKTPCRCDCRRGENGPAATGGDSTRPIPCQTKGMT